MAFQDSSARKQSRRFVRALPLILLVIGLIFLAGCVAIDSGTKDEDGRSSSQLEVIEQESFADGYDIKIVGKVRNNSKEAIDKAIVSGNAYDDEGSVIGTETTEIEEIDAGEEVPFEITIKPTVEDFDSMEWHCTTDVE